jgi:hypothetical protein
MRDAVEFMELACTVTQAPDLDELSLMFGGARLWSGRMEPGTTASVGLIKAMPRESGVIKLWQINGTERALTGLGRHRVAATDDDPADEGAGVRTARFTRDGAEYALTYRVLRIPG